MVDIDNLGIDSLAAAMEAPQEGEVVVDIAHGLITPDPNQPRKHRNPGSDKELAESIKAAGVRQPIIVLPPDEEGVHVIVFGERRWDCSGRAGKTTVPCIVRQMDPKEVLIAQLSENLDRDDMTLVDEVEGVRRAVEELGSAVAAAKALGRPRTWVSKRQKIAKSNEFLQEFLKAGYSVDAEGFYQLAKLAEKHEKAAHHLVTQWHADPKKRASLRLQVAELVGRLESASNDTDSEKGSGTDKKSSAGKSEATRGVSMQKENLDPENSPPRLGPDEASNSTLNAKSGAKNKGQEEENIPVLVESFMRTSNGYLLVTEHGEMFVQFADGVLEGMYNEATEPE